MIFRMTWLLRILPRQQQEERGDGKCQTFLPAWTIMKHGARWLFPLYTGTLVTRKMCGFTMTASLLVTWRRSSLRYAHPRWSNLYQLMVRSFTSWVFSFSILWELMVACRLQHDYPIGYIRLALQGWPLSTYILLTTFKPTTSAESMRNGFSKIFDFFGGKIRYVTNHLRQP